MKIVAFDEEDETIAGVRSGAIYATVIQQPFEIGRQAIAVLAATLRGDKSAIPADKKIIIPARVVRKDNVDAIVKQIDGWRGRAPKA